MSLGISYPYDIYCSSTNYTTSEQSHYGITGQQGGTFSSSPNGLSINSTTGQINASASQPGNYTITYTVDNTIPSSDPNYIYCGATTTTIQIDEDPNFTYSKSSYCQSENDFSPNFIANPGGTFTVSPSSGLSLHSGTGEIDPSLSTPGTYSLTYTTPTCSITTNPPVTVEILASPTVDAGTDFGSQNNVPGKPGKLLKKPGSGFSVGTGVIVTTPVGPLRLEVASQDFTGEWRFNLGVGWKF